MSFDIKKFDITERWYVAPEDAVTHKKVGKGYVRTIFDTIDSERFWAEMFERESADFLEEHGRTDERTVLVSVYVHGKTFDELEAEHGG